MKPTLEQIAKAKACPHRRKDSFIDGTFTGIGTICLDCRLVLHWDKRPYPDAPDPLAKKEQNILKFIKAGASD